MPIKNAGFYGCVIAGASIGLIAGPVGSIFGGSVGGIVGILWDIRDERRNGHAS